MSDAAPPGAERLVPDARADSDAADELPLEERERLALEELEWELSGPHTTVEIAARLGVSAQTIRHWTERALQKMGRIAEHRGLDCAIVFRD